MDGIGKSSVRLITKDKESKLVAIRTSQDTNFAFTRTKNDTGWITLDDVEVVVVVSVDSKDNPKFAHVHFFDSDEIRQRFTRAYIARKNAGRKIKNGRGVWIPLYQREANNPVNLVGAGIGLAIKPIRIVPI